MRTIAPILAGVLCMCGCAMQSSTNLVGEPTRNLAPRVIVIDSRISVPMEHLLDDFDKDSAIAQRALLDSLVAITARRFPASIVKLAGQEFFDSTETGAIRDSSWTFLRPKLATLRHAQGDSGTMLLLTDAAFHAGARPLGAFERIWYRDLKTGMLRSQLSFVYSGLAGLINQATGRTEMLQSGKGYADYTFAVTRGDWFRAYDRRLDALGASPRSDPGSSRNDSD